MNEKLRHDRAKIDWQNIGSILAANAAQKVKADEYSFDGVIIYASFNPKNTENKLTESEA